jgi:uncharacterized membrane protein YjgN (DUF898 family)
MMPASKLEGGSMPADAIEAGGPPPLSWGAAPRGWGAAPQSASGAPVVAGGEGLARLAWRGSLLTVLTLGIYRFWYRTDLRRWYWRHTSLAGSALEYRGTAKELLLGFLFALAVLVPLYTVVALGGLFAGQVVGVALNVLFAFVFLFLVQYGAYRSRRYRLTRTVWRGLRFDQRGSAFAYAGLSFLWLFPVALTLGLLFPLMRRSLEGYRIRNTRFGSAEGRFAAPAGPLMVTWLLLLAPLVIAGAFGLAALASLSQDHAGAAATAGGAAAIFAVIGVLWGPLYWPYYRIREFRAFADGTAIGPVSFRSAATAGAAYAIYAKFFLVSSVAGSALGVLATAAVAAGGGPEQAFQGSRAIAVGAALAILYLGGFLGFGVLKELMLNQPFWRLTAGTLTAKGLEGLDAIVAQAVTAESATGEGFADALDFGGV